MHAVGAGMTAQIEFSMDHEASQRSYGVASLDEASPISWCAAPYLSSPS